VHLDGSSCHKQHHDIYSLAQRDGAGRDCTCSFNPMVGTACYTVGSSRRVMLKAAPCKLRRRCGEDCIGCQKKPWLHSGDIMYFNKAWNRTWTHGIPHHDLEADGEIGPRVSIALLCAEADFSVPYISNGQGAEALACQIKASGASNNLLRASNHATQPKCSTNDGNGACQAQSTSVSSGLEIE
jgi:hypothetical protein